MNKECYNILSELYECRAYAVPCLLGPPGIGKTESVYALAEDKGAKVVEIIASQCNPTEVAGFVMPDQESGEAVIYDPHRLRELEDGDILFFDELLQAPQSVLSACLTIIEERRLMSGYKLPDVFIVAAANPTISSSVVQLPIRQRFMFFEIDFKGKDFADYLEDKYGLQNVGHHLFQAVQSLVNTEGTQWNVITPRIFEKAIKMYLAHVPSMLIAQMSSTNVAKMIRDLFEENERIGNNGAIENLTASNIGEKIYDTVINGSVADLYARSLGKTDDEVRNAFRSMSASEIIEWVEALPGHISATVKEKLEEETLHV